MEPVKVSVELTIPEWNVIINGLAQRPYIEVADIISSVKAQAEERINNLNEMAKAINEAAKPDHPSQPANAVKAA
jgi:hypothetical protein